MIDFDNMSDYELREIAYGGGAQQAEAPAPAPQPAPSAQAPQRAGGLDFDGMSDEELMRIAGIDGGAADMRSAGERLESYYSGTRNNTLDDGADWGEAALEGVKGAGRAAKAIGGGFIGIGSGAVRLAGTPIRLVSGLDGLHRVADAIDSGYENWGADALASELPDDDWGRVLGRFGEKVAGTAGSLGAMAAGGGLAKLGAAGKLGAASKAVGTAGAVLQKSLPFIFGNDAAVRTYDTAKANGSGTMRALGLASVNGAIHYFGFKAFENQSLNKMLGMPQEMGAMMPGWAKAAMDRNVAGNTFTSLASGVRNGMFKYILADRAKGALKAGGIMGLQNFLSSIPTQWAEGQDIDWSRAVSEGVGGVEEGALMEALMGGAAMLKTPKAARKFISETLFRKGWKASNGKYMPGLLHSPEGRAFVMKQNPDMQARILDIVEHGGKVTKGELNAACLPPDMTEAELREFAKDWRRDIDAYTEEAWNADAPRNEKPEPPKPPRYVPLSAEEAEAQRREIDTERAVDEAWNADDPNRPAPPIDAAEPPRYTPLSADEAEAQLRAKKADETPAEQPTEQIKQPKEVTNETGNVPVEAQPEPPVQDAGRGGQQQAPQAAEGLVEGEAPRGEVPAAGEVAEARPAEAKPVAPAPATAQEPKPAEPKSVSKSDVGGQKLTGGAKDSVASDMARMPLDELARLPPDQTRAELQRRLAENARKQDEIRFSGRQNKDTASVVNGLVEERARIEKMLGGKVDDRAENSQASEPPKNGPASAQSAEGTVTPPQGAEPVQGGETAAGGAVEETPPTKGNKLRRGGGKKGNKGQELRTQADADVATQATKEAEPVESATPATPEATPEATATPESATTPATPEAPAAKDNKLKPATVAKRGRKVTPDAEPEEAPAPTTPAPTAAEQTQPASMFRDKNGNMKKTLRVAVERIASAIGNRTGKGAITPEEADAIVNGIAESPELKHNRTRQFFTPLVTDAEWQNSLGVDAESAKNLRDAVVRARDASQQKKHQRKLDNALRAADAGDKDAPTAYGLVRIASDALDKARMKGDKAAEARAQKALEDAQAKFLAEYEQVPEANREKFVKEQEKQFEEWSKKHDEVARNESVTADAPIQGKDGSSTTLAEQLPAKSTNRVEKGRYGKGYVGEIKGVDGDEVHIAYYDADGKFLRDEKVTLDTLRERGKVLEQYKELADAVEAKGEDAESTSVRFERAAPESPADRDAKFAADADYQRWLKARKANDAEPLRQRYEMEQAKALGDMYKNAVRGVDVEYVGDRDYDPAKDNQNGGRELKDRDTGTVLGIFDRDTGKLKLFRGANWKTLNHEFGHATMRYAEQEAERGNRALLDKINESIDNAPQWLKDEVRRRYPDADEATLRDEIWAALRERPSEAMQKYVKTLQGRRWYNRAWDAIKTAWRGILSRMGFNRADLSGVDKMTPDEFNEFLDKAMIGGKTLGRLKGGEAGNALRKALNGEQGAKVIGDEQKEKLLSQLKKEFDNDAENLYKEVVEERPMSVKELETELAYSVFDADRNPRESARDFLRRAGIIQDANELTTEQKQKVLDVLRKEYENDADYLYNEVIGDDRVTYDQLEANLAMSLFDTDAIPRKSARDFMARAGLVATYGSGTTRREGGPSQVRMARGPAAPGHRILDDEIARGEKIREAVDDSRIIPRHVQEEIGYRDKKDPASVGIEEVMDPKTGFVDWRKSSDMDQAADKVNGFEQKHGHILQTRLDAITKELSDMKGLSEEAARELAKNYLVALHAEERNRTVATRRKDTYNDDYAEGAGISKADADKILASADVQKYKPQLQEISRIVREVANEDLRLRMENGLISQDQYDFYTKKWKNYVPLRTDVTDNGRLTEEAGVFNSSTASLGRNEFRTARGRGKGNIADDPIAFLFAQANDGIVKSGKNVIGNVSANAVGVADAKKLNKTTVTKPDGSTATEYMMAEIVPADVVKHGGTEFAFTFADGTKARVGGDMQLASNQENIQLFKKPEPVLDAKGNPVLDASGKPKMEARLYAIRWNPGANGRGTALAKALKGDNMAKVQWWMRPFANATRYLSRMNTSMSPSFLTSNIFNDRNEAWRTLMARFGVLDGSAMAAKVWGNRYRDGKAIKAWIENGDLSQSADFKQFIDGGGSIKGGNVAHGYSGELQMIQDNYAKYERASKSWLERLTSIRDSSGKISPRHWLKMQGKILRDVGNVVQTANEVEEIGTRYGVYKAVRDQLIKQGVDPNTAHGEAIKFSREATTNFNRRGTLAPVIGSFYMFWNANVQGHKRNLQTLTDKHNVQTFATLAGLAVATTLLRTWLGNDEEKKKAGGRIANNAPEHQKQASMGVLLPGGVEATLLKTRGIDSLIPYAATKFTEALVRDDVKAMDALGDMLNAAVGEAAGVLGGNGVANKSQISQTFMPSVIDPIIQWTSGTDWKGEQRVKQSFNKTAPKAYNGKNNTHPAFKWIAETVNDLTGGNSLRKGWGDMAPEDVQLIVETLAGGLGRDITGAMNTYSNVKSVASGGSSDRMFSQMPVVKSLLREYPESTSRYYAALEEYDADKAEFKKTTELGRRAEMKKAHPYLTAQKGRVDTLIEQVKELTHRERGDVKVGQKWVPARVEPSEERKEAFRKRRLRLQAEVLRILGK